MQYLSVCSGIEAASVAWHPLGWQPVAFSEIDPFTSAVLAHHYPEVPNLGDMKRYKEWDYERLGTIDLLVGGTPCQSFSVAGLRKGLEDPRGNLMFTYLGIIESIRPRWVIWENVPGVLSSNSGRDFGAFVGALGQLGYGWAYRIMDAQWFGVPQTRRRVFVVGHIGDTRRAAKVLFESESVRRSPTPRRPKTQGFTADVANCLRSGGNGGVPSSRGEHLVGSQDNAITTVRRLTPTEWERLQGFPDQYTAIPWKGHLASACPDGPRYKSLGNSMAVPVMHWIGKRIADQSQEA